ncbi:glycosyltransferase family 25 protein [Vibrio cholerae]|uniref:glycosyltransferase family 25 protein n=1 Tax=Vibrio cholerae TaxID=666 RepID=UPI0011D9E21F|nr:glycosyltransferase family 25 protein [Vibrio cholerae]TXY76653.1 glycosyltransferase family 25 protein [Vibrio cholerae]GHX92058.1 Lex2B protein [Vibrio cholerae]GIB17727.1 Lex2B protein [Vibrio cholerae]
MKIFVISLKNSIERRERVIESFSRMNLKFEFFDAIYGKDGLPEDLVNKPDDLHRRIFRSRPLSPGERGCFASHYRLWEMCVKMGQPILILEDDCIPTEFFSSVLSQLESLHSKGYEYLRVEPQDGAFTAIEVFQGMQIVLWHNNLSGTRGYSISVEGAKKLLRNSKKWHCAVDNFIGESYKTKLYGMGIIPYMVLDPQDMMTTIQDPSGHVKVPIHFKLTRELFRFYRFSRRVIWNFSSINKLKK